MSVELTMLLYSTALFLNHAGEVEILNDANGDGHYETITSGEKEEGHLSNRLTNLAALYAVFCVKKILCIRDCCNQSTVSSLGGQYDFVH